MLAKHPEYLDKLHEEISTRYKDIDDFQSIELEKLPILNGIVRETLRLYPPAPGPIARMTPTGGADLGGYHIPGGVYSKSMDLTVRLEFPIRHGLLLTIRIFILIQNRSNLKGDIKCTKTYGRWFDLSREDEQKLWDHSMIFSYGPRVCLGREYFVD